MADYAVILVHTTSHAVFAERVLKRVNIAAKLIPTPRHLSSDCGSAVRIGVNEQNLARQQLDEAHVEYDRIEPLDE